MEIHEREAYDRELPSHQRETEGTNNMRSIQKTINTIARALWEIVWNLNLGPCRQE